MGGVSEETAAVSAIDALPPKRRDSLGWQVLGEVRWSFTAPLTWLLGVGVNLGLSLLWLIVLPLTGRHRADWAIVVGTYFATFILADVTTTNVLGLDALRVRVSLVRGVSVRRILAVKNFALLLIVGVPTLVATAILTMTSAGAYRLVATLPGVALPILTWLGVGNVISVLLPVAVAPLRDRWRHRGHVRATSRWLFHLGLPYALFYAIDPLGHVPGAVLRHSRVLHQNLEDRGVVSALIGLSLWIVGTAAALLIVRRIR